VWETVISSIWDCVNLPRTIATGDDIHIGFFDSVYKPPENADITLGHTESVITSDSTETNIHGANVTTLALAFASEATYSFYQVVNESGRFGISEFAEGIARAIQHDLDLINVSAGAHMEGCQGHCAFCTAVSRCLQAGIGVVAAAGNAAPDGPPERINCPANREGVIAVGGMITECHCTENHPDVDIDDPPPGAFYPSPVTEQLADMTHEAPICGQEGCTADIICIGNQVDTPWRGNPTPIRDKPDVLAPCYTVYTTDDGTETFTFGSSFAAPVVTGTLAAILSEVAAETDKTVPADQLRSLVRESAAIVDQSGAKKLDGTRLLNDCLAAVSSKD